MNNKPPELPPQKPRGEHPLNDGQNQPPTPPIPNKNAQRVWIIVGVVMILALMFFLSGGSRPSQDSYPMAALVREVNAENVASIVQDGNANVLITLRSGGTRQMSIPLGTDIGQLLGTTYQVETPKLLVANIGYLPIDDTGAFLFQLLLGIGPMILIIWLIWRMMRSVRGQQDQAMSFGRSRARVARDMERPQVTFNDVAGGDEAKEELKEVVEFLKEPEKFIRLGARVPKGVLMVGPPGTGKTLMARAVAGEAGVPFFSISGSEFVEMFVGVGASRVRDLFDRAKAEAPAIIFIDEIDAVGRHRGAGLGGGHDEREQTLNQILVEMDGFETGTNIIICAATNRPDILDPALLRPGRFDRKVIMDNPDVRGRLDILKVHAKGKPLAPGVDLEAIARITAGFSGADLENLINEAAILAARRNLKTIGMSELQESMERVVMGPERKSRVINEKTKKTLAYHEAGHAILHHVLEHANAVHKITIVPRGRAGGYVMSLPDEDDTMIATREQFEDFIVAALGGRAAEEIALQQFTTGASNDLQQATRTARSMVTQFGMSDKLGPRAYGGSGQTVFLGREIGEQRDYSEHYAEEIDNEVKRILQECYQRAKNIISQYRTKLDELADVLVVEETLDREAFEKIMLSSANGGQVS
ncbi:MAG TPA: ATP-dependent zinc metalloprotease FtsH [Aggregatilineales bacterium]|nr:ATP-dependent zinc metalloprotease FtsH [Aggregatilineales bacterium]